jgi:3-dehydroquinate synthase
MNAATRLAVTAAGLPANEAERIIRVVDSIGPIPATAGIEAQSLTARLVSDKKTMQGRVHFVLPVRIGEVKILSGIPQEQVLAAIEETLQVAV